MFALVAAVIAFLVLIIDDFNRETALWLWLGFIALHFAISWWPFAWTAPDRRNVP